MCQFNLRSREDPGGARVSRVGEGVSPSRILSKDCFGETPKPTRETRALPGGFAAPRVLFFWCRRRRGRRSAFFNREGPMRLDFFAARFCLDDYTAFIAQLFRYLIGNGVGFRIKGSRHNA